MFPVGTLAFCAIVSATAFLLWKVFRRVWYDPYRSSLRHLRGPKGPKLILGNLSDLTNDVSHGHLMHVRLIGFIPLGDWHAYGNVGERAWGHAETQGTLECSFLSPKSQTVNSVVELSMLVT